MNGPKHFKAQAFRLLCICGFKILYTAGRDLTMAEHMSGRLYRFQVNQNNNDFELELDG